jgi:hypothetical protein
MSARRLSFALFASAAGVALAACAALVLLAGAASADGHVSLSGERIKVYNLAGKMDVVAGSGSSVTVDIVDGGRDASRLRVERGVDLGTHWLAIAYPGDRIVSPRLSRGSSCDLWVREDGRFGGRESRLNARKVRITGSGSGTEAWADLRIAVPPGQDVAVYLGVGEAVISNVDGKLSIDCASASVTSRGTKGRLSIDTGSGDVTVDGAQGDLAIDTGSGGVAASHLRSARVAIDTGSGSIRIDDAVTTSLALDTGSGSVECLRLTADNVAIDTGSGEVELDFLRDADRVAIDTGSGDVTVRAPASFGAEISIETGSGGIHSDFPMRVRRKDGDSLRGTIGDGDGHVVIETGSGSVRFAKSAG